jgi:ABC-type multidrug transport system ATPase subunit
VDTVSRFALRFDRVTRQWRRGIPGLAVSVDAVRDITLDLHLGEVTGLVGPNGAGKSTLLLLGAGLLVPDAGAITWLGRTRQHPPRDIAYVAERPACYAFFTVREAVEHVARLHGVASHRRARRVGEVLDRVGLAPHADKRTHALSRGMIQRLGIAQGLMASPRLLLLDETLSGLDPVTRREMRELLGDLARQGAAVLLASHDLDAIGRVADRVVVLREGRIAAELDPRAADLGARLLIACDPEAAQVVLARSAPWARPTARAGGISVPLADGRRAEDVLSALYRDGVAVRASQVVVDDLESRYLALVRSTEPPRSGDTDAPHASGKPSAEAA